MSKKKISKQSAFPKIIHVRRDHDGRKEFLTASDGIKMFEHKDQIAIYELKAIKKLNIDWKLE